MGSLPLRYVAAFSNYSVSSISRNDFIFQIASPLSSNHKQTEPVLSRFDNGDAVAILLLPSSKKCEVSSRRVDMGNAGIRLRYSGSLKLTSFAGPSPILPDNQKLAMGIVRVIPGHRKYTNQMEVLNGSM